MQITPESVAKAVDGYVDRDGTVICFCPIHETGPGSSNFLRGPFRRRSFGTCRRGGLPGTGVFRFFAADLRAVSAA